MAGNVVSNVKKYYGGQVPVPGQGDSDGKVKVLVEKTTTMEIEGVQTDVDLLYDADDLTTPVTPQKLGQWTDENYLIAFKKREDDGHVRGFILYALETDSTSTDTLVNRAEFIAFKENMAGDPGASAFVFTMVEDSSTLSRYLQDEDGELTVKFNMSCIKAGEQSGYLSDLIDTDSSYMRFEIVRDGEDNAYINLNTDNLDDELEGINERLDVIEGILGELPSDEHGYFNSSLYQTPGDGTTESLVIDDFRISKGMSVHGDNIEFVPTHQEGGVDFGEVYLNPGTYILNVHYTLQWVGNPRGTFLPLVANVGEQPFDFSYEHEDILRSTRIVTKTTRGKFGLNFPFDADTPPMGIWVKYLEIAQIASYNHPAVTHDSTLAGSGQIGDPLKVTPAAFGKVKDIPTSISQFRNGDVIPVDGPSGPAKMGKTDLLKETAQTNLENNFLGAFDADSHSTEETQYLKGQQVSHLGRFWQFNKNHYGAWIVTDADEIDAKQIFSANAVSTFFDNSVKTFSMTGASRFIYIPIKFYKGLNYKLKVSVYSTDATLVNDKTRNATGQLIYTAKAANKKTQFIADDNYAYIRIYLSTQGGTGVVELSNFTLNDYISVDTTKLHQICSTNVGVVTGDYHSPTLFRLYHEKGVVYRFRNTGSQQVAIYLMKSESSDQSEVAVVLSSAFNPNNVIDYVVDDTEFAYLSVYNVGIPGSVAEVTIEQLASNGNLYTKIRELAQGIAAKKFSSFSVIGDSYSTYQGYLPSGYATYYQDGSGSVVLTNGVFDTWWFKLATLLKIPLFRNDSWSGSTISNSVRPGLPTSSSFVNRIDSLFSSSKITDCKAGLILLFGGTNDSWIGNDHGQVKYSDWTSTDLEKTLPAFCYCLDKLLRWNPGSQVVFVLNNGLNATMSSGMITACEHYGVPVVELHGIDKSSGHPTSSGMTTICSQIAEVLASL